MSDAKKSNKNTKAKNAKTTEQPQEANKKNASTAAKTQQKSDKKTNQPEQEQKAKEEEELKKQVILKQQIEELETQLNFEKAQRVKLIENKKDEITKKDAAIKEMEKSNKQLEIEIKKL